MKFRVSTARILSTSWSTRNLNNLLSFLCTVKPVYNGHSWHLKNAVVMQGLSKKVSFRLAVMASEWPLLTGGRCWQVAIRSGLTVFLNMILFHLKPLFKNRFYKNSPWHFKKSEKTELEFYWKQIDWVFFSFFIFFYFLLYIKKLQKIWVFFILFKYSITKTK